MAMIPFSLARKRTLLARDSQVYYDIFLTVQTDRLDVSSKELGQLVARPRLKRKVLIITSSDVMLE